MKDPILDISDYSHISVGQSVTVVPLHVYRWLCAEPAAGLAAVALPGSRPLCTGSAAQ